MPVKYKGELIDELGGEMNTMREGIHFSVLNGTMLRRRVLVAALMLALAGCGTRQARVDGHESLNATLWAQTSAEYIGSTTLAYRVATVNLDQALADTKWTAALEQDGDYGGLPTAVMLDLDQTVLDTSSYNARIILEHGSYSRETFNEWCRNFTAPAVPGAKKFLDHAVERGVRVIYYSARREALRDCTTSNLRALGMPLPDQQWLLLNEGTPLTSKEQQRTSMASKFRVVLLVGDNLDDFIGGSKTDAASRRALASQHAERWGREWIILPNPMYGHWESSLYGFDYSLPRDMQLEHKLQPLQR